MSEKEGGAVAWHIGAPPKPWSEEWFIAETIWGDRVVLRALPEEWTYDFKTADDTYIKRDKIKRWMQFPDSEFIAPDTLAIPDAAQERIRVLEQTADRREDAAYANGVKAALAIFHDFGLCVDQGAADLCEKIVNDRQAGVKADRAAFSTARPIPQEGKLVKCPICGAKEVGAISNTKMGCDECDYVGTREEFGARPIPEKEESNPAVPVDAIVNLVNHQQQCDEDGVMVQVSRQALCEVLAYITEVRPDNKWAARKEESK